MIVVKQSPAALKKAVSALNKGGVIVCPTDTVYGFLADATSKKAVEKIYKIKKRPKSKPLPVFVSGLKMARQLAEIDKQQAKILKKFWPGKYTFILNSKFKSQKSKVQIKNKKLYGIAKDTIALRIPKYKFLNNLIQKVNRPVVQTSVNISGEKSLTKIKDIVEKFKSEKKISLIIDVGDLKKGKPSKIHDFTRHVLTRLR